MKNEKGKNKRNQIIQISNYRIHICTNTLISLNYNWSYNNVSTQSA